MEIKLKEFVGAFAENKDTARDLRTQKIFPALDRGEDVILNFEGITAATQSFVHALISDVIRHYGVEVLGRVQFKSCHEDIKKVISIVVDYMQA